MNGISVQVGPRRIGRGLAEWGLFVARNRTYAVVVRICTLAMALTVVTGIVLTLAWQSASSPAPTVFCPAGRHVTGTDAAGWPVCAPDR